MSFASIFALFYSYFWAILKDWWWLILFIECIWIFKLTLFIWYHWRKNLYDAKDNDRVLLEIKIPEEILEPIKAMETVITGFWQIYAFPSWYEKWWQGEDPTGFTLEIACIDGIPHFYMRPCKRHRPIFEAHIYSQYPQAEIFEVEDYAKNVPQDLPNAEWDMWGTEYKNLKPWGYPIKTYTEFETGREEEEKRIDPIASLLEGMAVLKPGEQIWLQLRCLPVLDEYLPWHDAARALRDKIARRESKEVKFKPMVQEAAEFLIAGTVPEALKKEVESVIPVEMKLTPGEKLVLAALENKISKLGYLCNLRYIYLAKRDVMFKPNIRLAMSYLTNFVSDSTNALVPYPKTITKVKKNWYDWFWFIKRRTYLRKRRLFRSYVNRGWVGYPHPNVNGPDKQGSRYILTADEIASIYHFPGRITAQAPTLARVEARKGEPPSSLPID
ncbi:hypothetical protein L6250_02710 [Candidatus Parcubacteria bacterium]|nr:hypothetical protein [Patescibacteria group bacterium]MBU4466950.1 hypothetical protein [Patescibacteria group bacterium]MCG2688519.1 hypothetical protein [Candidatus Parcubacteria bacterium]